MAGDVFAGFGGEGFEVDGAEGAEELVATVDHDGGAARGKAVLREEDEEAREEVADVFRGLEVGRGAEEFGGELGVGTVVGRTEIVAGAKAGAGVASLGAAVAPGRSTVAAAGKTGLAVGRFRD